MSPFSPFFSLPSFEGDREQTKARAKSGASGVSCCKTYLAGAAKAVLKQDVRPETWGKRAGGDGERCSMPLRIEHQHFHDSRQRFCAEGAEWMVAVFLLLWILSQPSGQGCLKGWIPWACVGLGSNELKLSLILALRCQATSFPCLSFPIAKCKRWSRWPRSWAWTRSEAAAWGGSAPAHPVWALQIWSRLKIYLLQQISPFTTEISLWMAECWWQLRKCVLWLQVKHFILGVKLMRAAEYICLVYYHFVRYC